MSRHFAGLAVPTVGVNAFATAAPLVDKVIVVAYAQLFNFDSINFIESILLVSAD